MFVVANVNLRAAVAKLVIFFRQPSGFVVVHDVHDVQNATKECRSCRFR